MTVEQLLIECDVVRASSKRLAKCKPFSCDDSDLDEFFSKDCLINQGKLLGKTYLFCLKSQPDTIVVAFSLSNDSIRLTNRIADEDKEQFLADTELRDKTLKRFPAALIGRLGTNKDFAGQDTAQPSWTLSRCSSAPITAQDAVFLSLMLRTALTHFTSTRKTNSNILSKTNAWKPNTWALALGICP